MGLSVWSLFLLRTCSLVLLCSPTEDLEAGCLYRDLLLLLLTGDGVLEGFRVSRVEVRVDVSNVDIVGRNTE